MLHRLFKPTIAFACTLVLAGGARADQLFVRMTGQTSGLFGGWNNPVTELAGVPLAGYGQVEDLAWSVVSPRDAASGLPTGKRQHRPLSLRLRQSGAVLIIGNALTWNENLTEVRVRWFVSDATTGVPSAGQELILEGANVSSLSLYTVREQDGLVTYADVTLTYQSIGIEDPVLGYSYEDDWESPI